MRFINNVRSKGLNSCKPFKCYHLPVLSRIVLCRIGRGAVETQVYSCFVPQPTFFDLPGIILTTVSFLRTVTGRSSLRTRRMLP